jgi:hypothetical protein
LVTAGLIAGAGWVCTLVFRGPEARDAIITSAGVAFTVQLMTFGIARALVPTNLMAGWGAGMLVRLVTIFLHGFVGVRVLGQPMDAALVSLAAFFFLTTLVEPFFLTGPAHTTPRTTQ